MAQFRFVFIILYIHFIVIFRNFTKKTLNERKRISKFYRDKFKNKENGKSLLSKLPGVLILENLYIVTYCVYRYIYIYI